MRLDLGSDMKDCSDDPLRSIQRMCYRINVYILQYLYFAWYVLFRSFRNYEDIVTFEKGGKGVVRRYRGPIFMGN